jgi:hypothetical protein
MTLVFLLGHSGPTFTEYGQEKWPFARIPAFLRLPDLHALSASNDLK